MKKYLLTALIALTLPQSVQAQEMAQPQTPQPKAAQPQTATPVPAPPAPALAPTAPPVPDTVVATVGNTDYTYGQFAQLFKIAIARNLNSQGMPYSEDVAKQFASLSPSFLPVYGRQKALVQLATGAGFKSDPAAIDQQVQVLKTQLKTDTALTDALKASGFASINEYRDYFAEQQLVSNYLKSVQDRFKFSDSLISSFYTMHKKSFNQPATACAKHILVNDEAQAQQIVKDLAAGGDFAKIAQEKSKDPGSAAKGGDLGCYGQGQMVPEFDKASFSGPLNQVQLVKSQFGYHIVVVTKRTEAGVRPLSEVQESIRSQLAGEAAQKYVDSQLKHIPIQLYPDRLGVVAPVSAPQPVPAKK